MEFNVFGKSIIIDSERAEYNQYRLFFQQEASAAAQHFQELYQSNKSLEMVIENAESQMEECVHLAISKCINILVKHGILTIDEERFCNMYPQLSEYCEDSYLKIYDQYAEIVMTEEQKDQYRVARRKGRGKWRGGGFGLSGAVKGAATAGALNMISGTGHMVFNGVAKIGSSMAASSKKNKIFRDEDTFLCLKRGVSQTVFHLHILLLDCLAKNGEALEAARGIVSAKDSKSASAILENIPHITDYEQRRMAMMQSFQLDPYQAKWYWIALREFGDSNGELERLEKFFGMSVIRGEKERQINRFVQSLSLDTEEQALSAAQKLEEEKDRLHFVGETEQTKRVSDAVISFDTEYRTVDGIILSTRDLADIARSELAEIQEIEQRIDFDSLESIADGELKVQDYSSPVAVYHQKALRQKWIDLDEKLRTVDTLLPGGEKILCETYQEAEELQPIIENLKQRLDACGEGTEAEKPLIELKKAVESETLPSKVVENYVTEIDKRWKKIDKSLRTTLKKEYSSREAARSAEQQYEQIKTDFITGNPRKNGDKFRKRIESADFSDSIKNELLEELFQKENEKELKTIKTFSSVSAIIILIIVIASYFFHLSGTYDFMEKDIVLFGTSMKVMDIEIIDEFTFLDGMKNGLVVFGRCFGDIFVNGFWDYIEGFSYGLIGNIIWAFLGLFWIIIKQILIVIPKYLISLFVTFFQSASISYYIGYVIGSAIPIGVSQFSFDEDKQKENVERIKGWTFKKVFMSILAILIVVGVSAYFINTESVDQTESVSGIETQKLAEKITESETAEISEEAYKESCQIFDYKEYFRNDQKYMGEKIQVDIQISQVLKGDCRGYDNSGNEYYISDMRSEDDKFRLMEDDYITVYGEYAGVGGITRAIGDYDEDIFCINAKYIDLHDENGGLVSDSDQGQVEIGDLPENGIPIDYIFPSNYEEEVSWYSDTTKYYMIPYMSDGNPMVIFSDENNSYNYSMIYYASITSVESTEKGGLVCSGEMFMNINEPDNRNGIVEITWDSFEAIDSPSVRVLGEDQMIDRSMEADDYYYWGPLESSSSNEDTEFIFPDSNLRLLTESDINGKSAEELRIAKNEIYARRGRIFTSEDLREYFESKSWYQGYIPADQFEESVFNQIEKDNIAFIQRYIDNPLSAANDSGYASQGLALNDPQAIPQIPGTYHYYSDPSDRNSLSMELNIDRDGVYVSFNKDGHQEMRSLIVYNMNDQEYVDDTGTVGIYFDDYGKTATYHDSESGGYNGTYTYLP